MKPKDTPFLHLKKAKGKTYGYFNTGKRIDGKLITIPLGKLDADPAKFWKLYSTQLGHRRREPKHITTVGSLVDHFDALIDRSHRAASTKRVYGLYSAKIRAMFADFPADDLRRSEIALWLGTFPTTGARKMALTVFGLIYSKAKKAGMTESDPTLNMEVEHISDPYQPWPEALVYRGMEQGGAIGLTVALCFYTGQRIGDVARMKWADIVEGHIEVTQQKTGKQLSIPIHRELRAMLDRYPVGITTIVSKADGTPYTSAHLSRTVKAWSGEDTHGLRKNAVNALLDCECSVAEVQSITGQSLAMVEHYARQRKTKKSAGSAMKKWEGAA